MLIPISAMQSFRLCFPDNSRYASGVLFERDIEGKPWLSATDGRALLCLTWTEPDLASVSRQRGFPEAMNPIAGSSVFLDRASAQMVIGSRKQDAVRGFGPPGHQHRIACRETPSHPVFAAMSLAGEAIVSITPSDQPRAKFPDVRDIIYKCRDRLERLAGIRELPGVMPQKLGVPVMARLLDVLDRIGLDAVVFHATPQPETGGDPLLFHAWPNYEPGLWIRAVGAVMPLQSESKTEDVRWPGAMKAAPAPEPTFAEEVAAF